MYCMVFHKARYLVIARKYNLEIHLYADDTQIYITFRTSDDISEEIAIKRV